MSACGVGKRIRIPYRRLLGSFLMSESLRPPMSRSDAFQAGTPLRSVVRPVRRHVPLASPRSGRERNYFVVTKPRGRSSARFEKCSIRTSTFTTRSRSRALAPDHVIAREPRAGGLVGCISQPESRRTFLGFRTEFEIAPPALLSRGRAASQSGATRSITPREGRLLT